MQDNIQYVIMVFTSLFVVVDPLGALPIFLSLTHELSAQESHKVAKKATLLAFGIMTFFAIAGSFILAFFSISLSSFRVVGGILFFIIGFDMLGGRISRTRHEKETNQEFAEDISVSPLGIPLLCGPGAITVAMLMKQEANSLPRQLIFFIVLAAVGITTYTALLGAKKIYGFVGPIGNRVFLRLMGLLVMVMAVEYFSTGVKEIFKL
jgi:multiple antibiotic resistance protein